MIAEAIHQTVGIGVGVFLGALLGFGIRAKRGKAPALVGGSVLRTAILAGMFGWTVAALGVLVF